MDLAGLEGLGLSHLPKVWGFHGQKETLPLLLPTQPFREKGLLQDGEDNETQDPPGSGPTAHPSLISQPSSWSSLLRNLNPPAETLQTFLHLQSVNTNNEAIIIICRVIMRCA